MKNVHIGPKVELSDEELDYVAGGTITDGTSRTFRGFGDITDGSSNTVLLGERIRGGRGHDKIGILRWFWGSR